MKKKINFVTFDARFEILSANAYHALILSSLFEKLRDARDKTLVCKNRKPKDRMISIE